MRLACYLREYRGHRRSIDISRETGVHTARLSQIERGLMLPFDHEIEALEKAYGVPVEEWYPKRTLLCLESDPPHGHT